MYTIQKTKKRIWFRLLFRVLIFILALLVLTTIKKSGPVRGFFYELYRESSRVIFEFKTREVPAIESAHFRVFYSRNDEQYAKMVLGAAERFYPPVAKKYFFEKNHKIPIMIYSSREELNASFGWQSNESAIGVYYTGVIRVLSPAIWIEGNSPEEIQQTFVHAGPMAHELTHLVVDYATRGNCPRWLTEGLAQMEEYRLTGFRFVGSPGDKEYYSLKEMDERFDALENQALAYQGSLSVVEYIEVQYGGDILQDIINHLSKGKDIRQAIKDSIGIEMSELEQNWRERSGF